MKKPRAMSGRIAMSEAEIMAVVAAMTDEFREGMTKMVIERLESSLYADLHGSMRARCLLGGGLLAMFMVLFTMEQDAEVREWLVQFVESGARPAARAAEASLALEDKARKPAHAH